ncbi:hypothetical protein [Candidatus Nanohalococcus occultus]|uniref:Uncharacterized protein n=1 Tax=Candidatus Nanohalococcus occultus TaxID=2978047 RepID=A0ABY8CID5_9ARCH|nr:hypothetical protein SVXNc_0644 [Candidatus Nanohaloarchaeota archaeon SVXNc]
MNSTKDLEQAVYDQMEDAGVEVVNARILEDISDRKISYTEKDSRDDGIETFMYMDRHGKAVYGIQRGHVFKPRALGDARAVEQYAAQNPPGRTSQENPTVSGVAFRSIENTLDSEEYRHPMSQGIEAMLDAPGKPPSGWNSAQANRIKEKVIEES